mmetsp:Transcript_21044/g.23543  ORF Transcript_21044/g.23543 Transcript_21044/m.23543 type:complete len:216 (-) Transcript_21044:361-1008(-)
MIAINMAVSALRDIPGVIPSRNASVPLIRPVLHRLPVLRVERSINGVVVLPPDTPTVPLRIPVNAIMIVVITHNRSEMIWMNTAVHRPRDIPGVPHGINVSVPGRRNVSCRVFRVEILINTAANLPLDIPTVPIRDNVNDLVIAKRVFSVLRSMNQSTVVATTFPTYVKPSERDTIHNNVRVVLVVTLVVLTILPVVALCMNPCFVMATNTQTYV